MSLLCVGMQPRLLEDSMCALSNIAFVSDEIRLTIGRTVTSTIVEVARAFDKVRPVETGRSFELSTLCLGLPVRNVVLL